nr:pentapeptide repeat-containing protein [Nostoc sp. ChiQUE02]MDZ8228819.1 pentapeptide repeat-containing protein [Nostoc sp. ChiQUE02]
MPQDFSGQNLRGHSFKGQNLEAANFSGADIRGANFTGANLRGANFSHAKAGLQKHWIVSLILLTLLLIGLVGFITAFNFRRAEEYYLSFESIQRHTILPGVIMQILLIIFAIITVYRGLEIAVGATALAFAVAGIGTVVLSGDEAWLVIFMAAGFVVGGVFLALIGAVGGAVIWADDWLVAQAIVLSWSISGTFFLVCLMIGSRIGSGILAVAWTGGYALVGGLLINYIGWLILEKRQKFTLILQTVAVAIAIAGTSFRNTNLKDANFTHAILKSTDFRNANLTHTCWFQAQKLHLALVGTTYLEKLPVQELVITREGIDKNFDHQNLRGVNLQGAYLADASFIGADLSEANLQDANLTRAKLVQTQLDGTDFTGATLTGAYIQDWGITTDTKFDGVRCEYVYMRLPTKENPDPLRKPDNHKEVFADGEFGDFIQPIFDTLDLYHNQGVDPRAIAISFKQLAENHPDAELEIVAMEKRGQDKFLLRAKTAVTADKSELSAEYFEIYNQLKALAEQEVKALITEKDSRISDLQKMITTALQRPSFYSNIQVEEVGTMTNTPGGFSVGGSVGGNANNVQGDGNSVVQGDTTMTSDRNINTGGGNYNERIRGDYVQGNYYAAGQPQSLAEAAAEIQLLLKQLEQTYPTTTTSQQMVIAAEAINRIESNPTLKKRVINAVKEGGLAAFEKAIDNPAGAFIVGAIKGWQEVEAED